MTAKIYQFPTKENKREAAKRLNVVIESVEAIQEMRRLLPKKDK